MKIEEYKNIFQKEESHFYYLSIHKIIFDLINKFLPGQKKLKILDAGCGSGLLAKKLKSIGEVIAVDIHPQALKLTRSRGVKVKKTSITKLPFKENSFNLVTSIDVLYHQSVKNDQKALKEFYRVLKPNGILILRVPAISWLKRGSDKHVFTKKRYDKGELKEKLEKAGFKISFLSYINFLLLPPALISYLIEKLNAPEKTKSPLVSLPKHLNNLLAKFLFWEYKLAKLINLPIGLGLLAVCKKPTSGALHF